MNEQALANARIDLGQGVSVLPSIVAFGALRNLVILTSEMNRKSAGTWVQELVELLERIAKGQLL